MGLALAWLLPVGDLERWGWRVAILVGLAVVPIGLVMRRNLPETLDRVRDADRQRCARCCESIAMLRAAQWTDTMEGRAAGWRDALHDAGVAAGSALVVTSESRISSAQSAALTLLDLEPRPDAVFTTINFMTLGLMQAMAERGLRCPEDLAIAGFDDFPWAEAFHPRLTVVAQPAAQMGREAVALLFDRISKRRTGAPVRRVMRGELMVRDSCRRPLGWRSA